MTMILELPAELEARLKADAHARGVAPEIVVVEAVSARYAEQNDADDQRRQAALAGLGMFAGRGRSVDEFLTERHAEGHAEYEKWMAERLGNEVDNAAGDVS